MTKTKWYQKPIYLMVVLALVFSLGVAAVSMTGIVEASPGTIQVDVNDSGCVNGTQADPYGCVYCHIQDAIYDAADTGDTILVHPGKYDENLVIGEKSLTLQSTDGWQDTTIDPIGDSIIWIFGDADVTVQGFEITAGSYGIYITEVDSTVNILDCFIHDNAADGIGVDGHGDLLHIEGNIISQNGAAGAGCGINMTQAWDTTNILDNVIGAWVYDADPFNGNAGHGIHVGPVSDTGTITIEGNAISENGDEGINFGVGISGIFGDVTIRDNFIGGWTCYSGDYGYAGDPQRYGGNGGEGIYIFQAGNTSMVNIEGNKISENAWVLPDTGITIDSIYGVVTIAGNDIGAWEDSHGETYLGNEGQGILVSSVLSGAELTIGPDNCVKENSSHGIDILWGQTDSSIEIHHNLVDHNGPWVCGTGIKLGSGGVCGAIVRDNIITHNHKGIYLDEYSTQNTIQDNEIRDNGHGVWVEGDDNQILRNNILNNVEVTSGIHLTSYATGNIIRCNNIEGNLPYGVYNENVDEMVDATKNWWGHASGPSGAGSGSGDAVSENVTYAPWLPTEFQYCPECGAMPAVGGEAYPVSKLGILAPWIVLGAAIIAGVSLLALRRRQTQS